MYPEDYDKSKSLLRSERNTDRVVGLGGGWGGGVDGNLPFLKVFIAQIASYLRIWNEGNSLPLFVAKVASSLPSRCSPSSSDSDPDNVYNGEPFYCMCYDKNKALKEVKMSVCSFSECNLVCHERAEKWMRSYRRGDSRYHFTELQNHIKRGIYSLRGKQLRLVRRHKGWLGRRDVWNKLCFPAQKNALWYSFSFCLHRRPLCRRVIGFTHDDKVGLSDPAIVKVSSFLIIARERKSQEKFSSAITQCVTTRARRRPRVIGVSWRNGEKKDYPLRVITSVFAH